jgi:hypothetical protein
MVTVIRINRMRWLSAVRLGGAVAMLLPAACGANAEIHVSTGPDGVEIFSNLPRAPIVMQGKPAGVTRCNDADAASPATQLSPPVTEMISGQDSDAEAPGKSFLLDD